MSLLLPLLLAALLPQQVEVGPLSTQRLAADLEYLADDAFAGRDSAKPGAYAAARFVAARFAQIGLQPCGETWRHAFSVKPLMLQPCATFLQLDDHRFQPGDAFLPHPSAPEGKVSGPLIFGGYGLQEEASGFDCLQDLDVAGAVVLLLRFEPKASAGKRLSAAARLQTKLRHLESRGAAAVLLAEAPILFREVRDSLAVGHHYWPSFTPMYRMLDPLLGPAEIAAGYRANNFQLTDAKDQLVSRQQHQIALASKIPVAYVGRSVAEQMLRGTSVSLREWVERAEQEPQKARGLDCAKQVTLAVKHQWQAQSTAFNVVGMIPGSDPSLAKKWIVVGAHYDHVGKNQDGRIWNGADDNASGVAGMLGLAAYFMQPEHRPLRSMAFVGFSGEERGLLGSHAFLDQSIVPAENIALMLNFEMIGRAQKQSFTVIGGRSAVGMEAVVAGIALQDGWELQQNHQTFFDLSDQAPFHRMGIPTLLYTTGAHEDYHRPSDTVEKIQFDGIAVLCRHAAAVLQQMDARVKKIKGVDYLRLQQVIFGEELQLPGSWALPFRQRLDY